MLNDELHRARPHIAHGLGGGHRRLAHALAQLCGHARRGGFFQHLLVPALHRAIALEQMDAMPLAVGKHLHLDVARALHILFNQHRCIAKTVLRLALARGQGTGKVVGAAHHAHALAATTCAGFDQHWVTDFFSLAGQQRGILVNTVVAGHQGHTGLAHQLLGRGLQTHGTNGGGRRANEDQARIGAGLGEVGVLAQKPISRVDGLSAGLARGVDDALPLQVTVFGFGPTNV